MTLTPRGFLEEHKPRSLDQARAEKQRNGSQILPLGIYWDLLEIAEKAGDLTPEFMPVRDYRYRAEGIYSFLRTIANRYGPEHQALFFAFVNYAETHNSKPGRP